MEQPLFLTPVFQEKIWGGNQLETVFGYDLPSDKTGECWAISAHPHGVCDVQNGPYKGQKLDKLWQEERHLFGNATGEVFPLLTKILDAEDDLSVQVHPDDRYGLAHEGELGKTECWYVIAADPGAEIIYGHHAQTKEELRELISTGKWEQLLRRIPVKKGDFFYVPSGTIHAIGSGIMILETQQSSDTTYRVYDYDRTDDQGNPRELHIEQSIAVTNVPHIDPLPQLVENTQGNSRVTQFVKTPFFTVYDWRVVESLTLTQNSLYSLVSVIEGTGTLIITDPDNSDAKESYPLTKGTHFILPNQIKHWQLTGEMQLIASELG